MALSYFLKYFHFHKIFYLILCQWINWILIWCKGHRRNAFKPVSMTQHKYDEGWRAVKIYLSIKIRMLDWDLCANIKVAQLYCWPSEKTIISLAKLAKLLSIDRQLAHYHFVPHYHFSPSTIFFPNYHFITPLPFYHPATHYHGTLWTNHIHKS